MAAREGDRIELVSTTDEWARVPRGTRGTVAYVDALGTVHVNFDTGHRLGLIPGEDVWKAAHTWEGPSDGAA